MADQIEKVFNQQDIIKNSKWISTLLRKLRFHFLDTSMGIKAKIDGYLLDNIHSKIQRRQDVLESVQGDAEGKKLSGLALIGFVASEIKSRIPI